MSEQDAVYSFESRIFSRNILLLYLTAIKWNIIDARSLGPDKYVSGHIFSDSIDRIGNQSVVG